MFFMHKSGRSSPLMIYEDANCLKASALRCASAEENAPNFCVVGRKEGSPICLRDDLGTEISWPSLSGCLK